MKKKILSVLLSVLMVLSLLPAQVFAAGEITVYVTISNQGSIPVGEDADKTLMAEVPIQVQEGSTVDAVLQVVHETYCPSGYDNSTNKLWKNTQNLKSIALNGTPLSESSDKVTVSGGNHITAAIIREDSDHFVSFDSSYQSIEAGNTVNLTLKGRLSANQAEVAVSGASVGMVTGYGISELGKTDANGKVTLYFDKGGTYYISASGSVQDEVDVDGKKQTKDCAIIPPVCVVKVMGPRSSNFNLLNSLTEVVGGSNLCNFYQVSNGIPSKSAYFAPYVKTYSASVSETVTGITLSEALLMNLMPKDSEFAKTNCELFVGDTSILSAHTGNQGSSFASYADFAKELSKTPISVSKDITNLRLVYTRGSNPKETYELSFRIVKTNAVPSLAVDIVDHVVDYCPAQGNGAASQELSAFHPMLEGKTAWYRFTTLGSFGGYMTFSFDQPIQNDAKNPYGIDFILYGNNFKYAPDPEAGSVSVSEDGNTWYTLAGSMHYEQTTTKKEQVQLLNQTKTSALQIAEGKVEPVYGYGDVHTCSEVPFCEEDYSVTGIPGDIYSPDHVKAIGDGFDLMWAVDDNGKPVELKEIKFIRMQNAVNYSALYGPSSAEVGTIARTKVGDQQANAVGVTEGLSSLVVNGKDLVKETPSSSLYEGKNRYYEVNLNDSKVSVLELSAKGADSDHIVVNNAVFAGSASTKLLLNSDGSRMARVVVQNGQKEPVMYTIRVIGGGNPAKNAILSTMTLTPGDVQKSPDAQNAVSFEVAQNVSSMKLKLKTLNPNANIQISGGNLSAPMSVKSEVESEALALKTGINNFQIAVTSTDSSVVNLYTLAATRAESKPTSKVMTVSFKLMGDVDHSKGGSHQEPVWIDTTSVEIPTGSTVKYVTDLMLYNRGISFSNPGNYITKIVDPKSGTALEEFTNGPNSGWMYRLNGKIANSAYADRVLGSGDTLIWSYTDDYTKEKNYESYAPWKGTVVQPPETDAQTIKPVLTVKNGTASTTVKESQISDALAAAKKSGASEIAISLEPTEVAKRAEIFLPVASIQSMAGSSNLLLTVNAPQGTLQLPNELLSYLAKQNGGSELKLSMETRSASDLNLQGVNLEGAGIVEVKFSSGNTAITQFNGSLLTLRIPVSKDKGFVAGKRYHAITISGDSSRENTWADIVQQNGNLMAELKTKHLSTFIVTNQPVNRFTDVEKKAWYHDAVSYVASKGIMDGVGTDTFEPNASMTRAMLTTVLYRLEGKPSVKGENPYRDVASDAWYANAILWATQNKIVSGYGNGLFGTNERITREELATMLRNYAKLKNNSLSKSSDLSGYTDAKDISSWALDAMKWANGEGLLSGRENKALAPKGTATRAEVSALLMRFTTSMTH